MTQKELAEKSGINQQNISRWERGTREPQVSDVSALAAALGVEVQELFRDPSPESDQPHGRGRPSKPADQPLAREAPPPHPERKRSHKR